MSAADLHRALLARGETVAAEVVGTEGVDLIARVLVPAVAPAGR